jgi:hypothetical protein
VLFTVLLALVQHHEAAFISVASPSHQPRPKMVACCAVFRAVGRLTPNYKRATLSCSSAHCMAVEGELLSRAIRLDPADPRSQQLIALFFCLVFAPSVSPVVEQHCMATTEFWSEHCFHMLQHACVYTASTMTHSWLLYTIHTVQLAGVTG